MEPAQVKKCSKCKEIKELEEFYRNRGGKYGLNSRCKKCDNKAHLQYYYKNQDIVNTKNKAKYHQRTRSPEFVLAPNDTHLGYYKTHATFVNRVTGKRSNGTSPKKFSLKLEDLQKIWPTPPKCALSGLPITLGKTQHDIHMQSASLDRIDSSKGYELGNIQWVDKRIQKMKNNLSDDDFISLCGAVWEHNKKFDI